MENQIEELQTIIEVVEQQRNGACRDNAKMAAQIIILSKRIAAFQARIQELEAKQKKPTK